MANSTINNVDLGAVAIKDAIFLDEVVNFSGGDTYAAGTIMARHSGNNKLIPFVKGGNSNGNGIPKAVLTYPVERANAGDVTARALVRGHVNRDRLIIDADGDGSNIDDVVLDQLRAYGIVASPVEQLAQLDNQ
jgi:hypothetical protein